MRKTYLHTIFLLLVAVSSPTLLRAELPTHENILKLSFGGTWQVDPYLSAFRYDGLEIGIGNEWWQPFRSRHDTMPTNWSHVGRLDIRGMRLLSPARNNIYYGFGGHAGWGAYYHWQPVRGLQLQLGPYLELDYIGRTHTTSVNKPYSMDLGIDIEAMGGISYSFAAKRSGYRVRYLIRTNILGYEYMPDYWQSYYEISQGVPAQHLCSGPWNRLMLRHELTMDFRFAHSTWRLGIEHEMLRYGTCDMDFLRQQIHLVVGCIFRYRLQPSVHFDAL